MKDITFRAVEVLKSVDLIAAEDTRHTKILLDAYAIEKPLTSFFEHNQVGKTQHLIDLLKQGKSIALVSDAGTPGISDPGYVLIKMAQEQGIPMTVVPGACAAIMALTASGLPSHRFVFEGFLPVKSGARRNKLASLKEEEGTFIFYESPHRLLKALGDIKDVLGDIEIVVARELTKKFEDVRKAKTGELLSHFTRQAPKGEFVLLIQVSS